MTAIKIKIKMFILGERQQHNRVYTISSKLLYKEKKNKNLYKYSFNLHKFTLILLLLVEATVEAVEHPHQWSPKQGPSASLYLSPRVSHKTIKITLKHIHIC